MILTNVVYAVDVEETDLFDHDYVVTNEGAVLLLSIEEGHILYSRFEVGEVEETYTFTHSDEATVSCPRIKMDDTGTLVAAWMETTPEGAYYQVAFYDKGWLEPETVPEQLAVISNPSLSLDTGHTVSIAYIAVDDQDKTHVRLNHYDAPRWKSESIYTTDKELEEIHYLADGFGKEFVSWLNTTDGVMQILEKKRGRWKIALSQQADTSLPHFLTPTEEGAIIAAWVSPHRSIQTYRYEEDSWNYLEEIQLEHDPLAVMLTPSPEALFLGWLMDSEPPTAEMALLVGDSWQRVPIDLEEFLSLGSLDLEDGDDL